ncbi:type IV toxin-antitoxin system AbiEi family antitoxin domain-containing protein [Frigoribacterium sp. ACAM 257]|uniref:type IV toxin-antitoxin system AbiEi family antitoxin domain-containing protein n=1 Tax=Frigoribacterium sp. ACAM 257 TaxID=2508998 RepID=UPI0011BA00A4|nr:type IV toxin-antitoxin system AbiEi family antitoxin domain-containing protein [Frigoribacterium sp. ACAM 257]TWX36309.1 type IV toxin-antitoxin system AbiEi family antitoxin domain-containing protein [Frigoribacterium sp. ACAM 257]
MIDLAAQTSGLLTAKEARVGVGDSRALQRDAAAGRLVRIAHGAYVETDRWSSLLPRQRFVYRIAAAQRTAVRPIVFSHAAAAAPWGLPWWGAPPGLVEVTDPAARTSRAHRLTRVHALPLAGDVVDVDVDVDGGDGVGVHDGDSDFVEHLGVRLTSVGRTCADVLLDHRSLDATVVVDAALHLELTDPVRIAAFLDRRPAARAHARARRTLGACDPGADSAGESVSRVFVHGFGFPAPVLQQPWRDTFGLIGFTDMWWPDLGVIGEYDGDVKYLSDRWRRGRTPEQVVKDEKDREDRLRALPEVRGFARWGTAELRSPDRLRATLLAAGLRPAT